MCENFPSALNNLAYVHDAKIILQVHWTFMTQDNVQRDFKEEMMNIFIDEGNHSFLKQY